MIAVVAIDQAYGIGKDGALLKPIGADLKRFKSLTMGKVLIYGSKTLKTFPGEEPLKGRQNLILSRKLAPDAIPRAEIYPSLVALLERVDELKKAGRQEDDFCVIGGTSVYECMLSYYDKVYLTRIDAVFPADCYFPNLEDNGFKKKEESSWLEEDGVRFRYETWVRDL